LRILSAKTQRHRKTLGEVGDCVRIDGPRVWIKFRCQRGIHYHKIWRDRVSDYGAEFSF
jgi:hypothetical protein